MGYRPKFLTLWEPGTPVPQIQIREARKAFLCRTQISPHGWFQQRRSQQSQLCLCSQLSTVWAKNPISALLLQAMLSTLQDGAVCEHPQVRGGVPTPH